VAIDYSEHLDADSLRLLAETTGYMSSAQAAQPFQSQPHDIRVALASPRAASLLDLTEPQNPLQHRLLQLAVGVHQTAEDICQAGWIATDQSVIDLNLVSFSGQSRHQQFLVGLLASYLESPAPAGFDDVANATRPCSLPRLHELIDLCATANVTERAGVLRLLGDEALFTSGLFPAVAHDQRVDPTLVSSLDSVLPRAVTSLMDDLKPQLKTLLDVYLMFGPIWYRMASQDLLFSAGREPLSDIATDFAIARRFMVQVSQGPLEQLKYELYPQIS